MPYIGTMPQFQFVDFMISPTKAKYMFFVLNLKGEYSVYIKNIMTSWNSSVMFLQFQTPSETV